jgi:amino acid adenylation domain-containing protein
MSQDDSRFDNQIAVIGMAGRFPQAPTLERFWDNLRNGVEAISVFSDQELLSSGVSPETLARADYVRAGGILDGVDLFDAPFFGFSAREAALLDPQQRLFLECAWEALENAGYDSLRVDGPVGVYGGTSINSYYLYYLFSPRELLNSPGAAQSFLGSDKDFLATRLSYKLGLRGPSLSVQAACSTSLVAIHLACQSLLNGECDMALAGGSSVRIPQKTGAFYYPGGIVAPDGHCRAFDAEADGSVNGSAVGVVLLKRMEDAVADGDTIRAVIRGSAVNNDGALRVGYTAPSIEGQSAAVAEALALARVEPETVTYVETHGSATPLGDPIEIAALTHAFASDERGFCAVGSVKTSIGHCDAAAGIAGFAKTVLALEHGEIPPSLNFRTPNPNIDFANSPFFVNSQLRPWERDQSGGPRRAGVSSFGMGGTNAHIVLEEAPEPEPSGPSRPWQLLVLSAATPTALETATDNLVHHLDRHPAQDIADVAFTLLAGRRFLKHRRAVVCTDAADVRAAMAGRDPGRLLEAEEERTDRPVAFLLPGLGDHYPGMARGLYESEEAFREAVDRCCEILRPVLGRDLKPVIFDGAGEGEGGVDLRAMLGRSAAGESELDRTAFAQPALFVVEYALAQLWKEWGVEPKALLGYSLGEYVAACLAGTLSLEDALRLVALRAKLIEELPAGAMTAVPLPETEVRELLGAELSLSAVNGPAVCVVGGPPEAVAALEERLSGRGVTCRRLRTSHAFHSAMMRPAVDAFRRLLAEVELRAPEVPFLSNVTGSWIADEEATDPEYWVRHLLEPVRFGDAVAELWADPAQVLLEVGPGSSLSSLALQHPGAAAGRVAIPSLRPAFERRQDLPFALTALARLWLAGAPLDARGVYAGESRRRVPLPTYPFERQRCWVEADLGARLAGFGGAVGVPSEAGAVTAPPPGAVRTTRHARPGLPTPYVAPAGEVEKALAAMWEELLGIDPVGTRDSFFDLGGHSLLATQLVARVHEQFGVELPLSALFEANTITALAGRIAESGETERAAPAVPVEPLPRRERAPMSFAQQRLWFVDRLAPGNTAYNNPVTIRLTGPLDVPALTASLEEIVRRHDILRTTFAVTDGEPLQIVGPPEPVDLPVRDLRDRPEAEREREAWREMAELVKLPFDLARGPVRRHALLRLGDEEHLFVTVMHHILWDEWSQGIFVAELAALYEAFRDARTAPLPPLPIQFTDYAVWQRETLQGDVLEGHLSYWRERLDGVPRVLALPTDRPRPAAQSFRGASRPFSFPVEVHRGVAAVSQRHGVTPFMTLMAAFQALLWRYTGQEDLLVSTGTGGRGRVDAERLIGCFINILLLRGDLSGNPSFPELLERTRATTLGAFAHQDLPFELLVEALKVERDPSTPPLAQVMLVYLNVPQTRIELRDLTVEGVRIERSAAQLDLTLYLGEENGTLGGHLEYNTDLFEAATVERLLGHFQRLLEEVTPAGGTRPLTEVPLLRDAERAQAVHDWNRTAAPYPQAPLHELFEARADARSGAPALIFADQPFSYQEIDQRANRLAHRLLRLGEGAAIRNVGVALRHSPEVVVALQGILKAGGAYVPLDPDYPQERLSYMVEAARVQILITESALAGRFAGVGVPTLLVDAEAEDIAAESAERPAAGATLDDLVYVIFTSGSTGRPKGVLLDHRGRVSNFHDFNHRFDVGYGDRILALSSLSFDMSAYDILGTLSAGGALVLPKPEERLEPAAWTRMMARHRVSVWHSVPALLEMLVDHLERHPDAAPAALASLRLVLLGGDWIPVGLPARLRALSPRPETLQIISMGGATEVSMDSTIFEITRVDPSWKSIPYGVPMANQTAYVMSPGSPVGIEPAPVGVAGELVLGGIGVGCGYFGRPELTAEKFVPDALSGRPGSRVYRTGDLARYRPDGVLELLGRMDNQVKIRGFRIEPAEIAAALREHPGVRDAVVLARQDEPGVKRLVAYLIPEDPAAQLSPAEVRDSLKDRLPGYMVPSAFVVMPELPLTPNGKLDRRALPAPEASRDLESELVLPRTPLERVLADVWKSVFNLPQVGVFDNFFDLGGHSLGATRVITQLEEVFPLEIPLRTMFESPTVAGFAASLEALGAAAGVDVAGIAEVLVEIQEIPDHEVQGLLAPDGAGQEAEVSGGRSV